MKSPTPNEWEKIVQSVADVVAACENRAEAYAKAHEALRRDVAGIDGDANDFNQPNSDSSSRGNPSPAR